MTTSNPGEITRLHSLASQGDEEAQNELVEMLYKELHQLAHRRIKQEDRGAAHTWQTTDLVHEALVKLDFGLAVKNVVNRRVLFAAACRAIWRLLVDHGRKRRGQAHGHATADKELPIDRVWNDVHASGMDVESLKGPLEELYALNSRQYAAVLLRLFLNLSDRDIAAMYEVSMKTIERDRQMARAWLRSKIPKGVCDES